MANLQFSSELLDYVLFHASEPTDGTSDFDAQVLIELNRAYRAIWMGGGEYVPDMNEPWLWLKKDPPGVLVLDPVVDAGTVAVTNNSATITFSSAPAASQAGRFFRTDDHGDVFRIASHTGGVATATLDTVYTGDTNAAATYDAMKLEYSLAADILRPISPMRVQASTHDRIEGIALTTLDYDYPLRAMRGGLPDKFALVTETKVRFNRYGGLSATEFYRVEYDYLAKPADLTDSGSEEPLVPLEHRHIIADAALVSILASKDDSKKNDAIARVTAGLRAMQRDNQARLAQIGGSTMGHLFPRGRGYGGSRGVRVKLV